LNRAARAGELLSVTTTAADVDAPPQSLTYRLLEAPSGALIDAGRGVVRWLPTVGQAGRFYPVTIAVEDDGLPGLSAARTFIVAVAPVAKPAIEQVHLEGGTFAVSISGDAGLDYSVQASSNLVDWATVFTTNSPALPFNWTDPDAIFYRSRFYRILLGP
jgi:hypothetical protein